MVCPANPPRSGLFEALFLALVLAFAILSQISHRDRSDFKNRSLLIHYSLQSARTYEVLDKTTWFRQGEATRAKMAAKSASSGVQIRQS